jgi:hypothetical protein
MEETLKKYTHKYGGDSQPPMGAKKAYDEILSKLSSDWEVDVEIVICHANRDVVPAELDFEKFYIFAQMVPDMFSIKSAKLDKIDMGSEVIEVTGGQKDTIVIPTDVPSNVSVILDKSGQPLAVVHDASLYFLNDFIHCNNPAELERGIKTFKFVINEATKTPDLIRALKSGADEKGKRALEHVLQKQFKERLKKEMIQLESSTKIIDEYMSNLVKAQRKVMSSQSIIRALQSNISDIPSALEKKWDSTKKLAGSPLYESISFQKTCVKGTTTPIYIKHSGVWYNLGRFEVELGFGGIIKIHSLFAERGPSQDHPHVNGGNPCWGNMSGELPKRIAESEFDVAFVEIHTFLSHYSREGGPYATIDNWPAVSDPKVLEELNGKKKGAK